MLCVNYLFVFAAQDDFCGDVFSGVDILNHLRLNRVCPRKRPQRCEGMTNGQIFYLYLLLAGASGFVVEFVRINPRVLWGLSEAQLIAIVYDGGRNDCLLLVAQGGGLSCRNSRLR